MNKDSSSAEDADNIQLKKYAEDLSKVYESEKSKREELATAYELLKKYAEDLNRSASELAEAYLDTIYRLVLAAEYKDEDTGDHIVRMTRYSTLIAEKLGLPGKTVQNIFHAAPMHDIGKIGIPDNILMKQGKLTDEEFGVMKTHTNIGAKILAKSKAEILRMAQQIAISHHEKWNGKGYPQGFSGENIPLVGRIVAVADSFDAITSRRPYKDPYPVEVAFDIIQKDRGEHFDPDIVDVFLDNREEVLRIKAEVGGAEDVSLADFRWSERDQAANISLPGKEPGND